MKLATAAQDVNIPEVFERRNVAVGSTAMILDLFADKIYSQKERAVIRELSCNAHDSHVIAGTTDIPFDVHIPTALEPWFSIRDYGTGLPDEDIANIYGAIGISTKRDSNDVIGCFGVGSLAPYSMADSFVVKSYYNGTVRSYQCMRDDSRNPVVIPLGSAPTDEANGLEIKVTVADRASQFHTDAIEVFKFWSGTIPNVNDEDVMKAISDSKERYIFEGDDFGLTSDYGRMVAIMGNIAYEIPSSLGLDGWSSSGYMKFELGELEFDTSRERLDVSEKNREAIKAKQDSIKKVIVDIASEKVDSLDCAFERWKLANSMKYGLTSRLLGTAWFDKYSLPQLKDKQTKATQWEKSYNVHPRKSVVNQLYYTSKGMRFFLRKDKMTTRIKEYMRNLTKGYMLYVFDSVEQAESVGVPKNLLEDLDVLPKVSRVTYTKKGKASKCKTFKLTRSVGYRSSKDNWTEVEIDLGSNDEIIYVPISRWQVEGGGKLNCGTIIRALRVLTNHGVDIPSVHGLKSSFRNTKAFKSNNNFVYFKDWLKKTLIKLLPSSYDDSSSSNIKVLLNLENVFESKELQEIKQCCDNRNQMKVLVDTWKFNLDAKLPMQTSKVIDDKVNAYMEKYPMLAFMNWVPMDESPKFKALEKYIGAKAKDSA